jgi:hypothetical protein
MNGSISDECKKKLKDLEEKLVWSIQIAKDSPFRHSILPDVLTFLAVSCRFAGQNMDEPCKKIMSGYEDDILNLNIRAAAEKASGLDALLTKVKKDLQ